MNTFSPTKYRRKFPLDTYKNYQNRWGVSVLFFLKILVDLVYPFESIQQTKGVTPAQGYNGPPLVD